jgi:hypothetical protein
MEDDDFTLFGMYGGFSEGWPRLAHLPELMLIYCRIARDLPLPCRKARRARNETDSRQQ